MSRIGHDGLNRRQRLGVIAALYLVADIGYSYLFITLATVLLDRGVALGTVALVNLLGMFYFGRFLVGPVIDRIGSARHGHYRSWLLSTQVLLILALVALAAVDPSANLPVLVVLVVVVLVLSVFHDTALNGLAVRILKPADHGHATGIQMAAASMSLIIGSGGALLLYGKWGWGPTTLCVAAVYLIPFAVLARLVEPAGPERAPGTSLPLSELVSFLGHRRTLLWTVVAVPAFLLGDWLVSAPMAAMLLDAGWTTERIGLVMFTFAVVAMLLSSLVTGAAITRWGRWKPAVVIAALSTASIAGALPVASGSRDDWPTIVALVAMSACYGAKMTWIATVSLGLARPATAATDYTVAMAMTGAGKVALTSAGLFFAGVIGYPTLVWLAIAFAAVGLLPALVIRVRPQEHPDDLAESATTDAHRAV
ncbi:MFS transporter [Actinosynnema sp. NPDC023587]|uniref:MFS transporter n=1 Tax=Actinosynnema sp. NPDC023587 TaxID=3154695 RepID=UPI00340DDF56